MDRALSMFTVFLVLLLVAVGCLGGPQRDDGLSEKEIEALDLAIQDEYKARATYQKVIEDFGEVRPFTNIISAEEQHIKALQRLYVRYGLEIPEDTGQEKVSGYASIREACQAGVTAEVENAALYDRLLSDVEHDDIKLVFSQLRDASRNNHLPAFQNCA